MDNLIENESIYSLNLAFFDKPELSKDQTIERIKATRERIFPPHLYMPITNFKEQEQLQTDISCRELTALIGEVIDQTMESIDYNALNPLEKLVDYLNDHPQQRECLAFIDFMVSSADELEKTRGSTCIGNSLALVKVLKEKYQIDAEIVLERMDPLSPPQHAAALIRAKDGIVLIEPLNAKGSRIIPIPYGKKIEIAGDTFMASPSNAPGAPLFTKKSKSGQESQFLTNVLDADTAVMKKFLLRRHQYPVVGYKDSKPVKVIKVVPDQEKIIFQSGSGQTAKVEREMCFSEVESNPEEFALFLTQFMDKIYGSSPELIAKQITKIVKSKEKIKALYKQVHAPKTAPKPLDTPLSAQKQKISRFFSNDDTNYTLPNKPL